ncbi:MAG: hypothetical protein KTR26_09405 [Flammeovirgaceae bacterium]|nr:hypothetical protein [Flammeovirgaceae bacterium]
MKKLLVVFSLTGLFLLGIQSISNAQITNVKIEKGTAFVYNKNASNNVKFKVGGDVKVTGFNERYVVINNKTELSIYDNGGKFRKKMTVPSGTKGIKITDKNILIKDSRNYVNYYDFNGNYLKKVMQ